MSADPSGSGRRRSRGGRSRCTQHPDGGSNHQNEPDDNSGGSCGGGQQHQRKSALACRLDHQDGNWDAIGLSLKNIADGLKLHRQVGFDSKFNSNSTISKLKKAMLIWTFFALIVFSRFLFPECHCWRNSSTWIHCFSSARTRRSRSETSRRF
jgi:hypothetical protein